MSGFFNVENKFFTTMGKIWDMLMLNVLWVVLSFYCFFIFFQFIPESMASVGMIIIVLVQGITIGPATTALYYTVVKVIRRERGYVFRQFFSSFKQNFKQGAIIGEIYLVISYILWIDFQYANSLISSGNKFGYVFQIGANAILVVIVITLLYIFPILSRFTLKTVGTFKTALLMAVKHFPTTLGLFLIVGACGFGIYVILPTILILPSVCALLISMLMERVFKKYMQKPEGEPEETGKDTWYLE